MPNKFRQTRVELFNEEFSNYNPLFVGQGDAPTHDMAYGLRCISPEQAISIDVGCLTGLDLGRIVAQKLATTNKINPKDVDPQVSPLAPVAKPLIVKVHQEVPIATAAYQNQIVSAYNDIKTNKLDAAKVLESLSRKGVSPTVVVETFKMIERGVPAQNIKNEVIDLISKSSQTKPPGRTTKPITVKDIVKIDTTPEYPANSSKQVTVSTNEVAKTSALINSDPVIQGYVKQTGGTVTQAATSIAVSQVNHVLATLASKAIIDGERKPTDVEVSKATTVQPSSPQPITVATEKSSSLPWVLGGLAIVAIAVGVSSK
jgi:hypothetical protein